MKTIITILFVLPVICLYSCSSDDDFEKNISERCFCVDNVEIEKIEKLNTGTRSLDAFFSDDTTNVSLYRDTEGTELYRPNSGNMAYYYKNYKWNTDSSPIVFTGNNTADKGYVTAFYPKNLGNNPKALKIDKHTSDSRIDVDYNHLIYYQPLESSKYVSYSNPRSSLYMKPLEAIVEVHIDRGNYSGRGYIEKFSIICNGLSRSCTLNSLTGELSDVKSIRKTYTLKRNVENISSLLFNLDLIPITNKETLLEIYITMDDKNVVFKYKKDFKAGYKYTINLTLQNKAESEAVDLGLPSGLKWAAGNLGAVDPSDVGLYFAYGETTGYTTLQINNNERKFDKSSYTDSSILTNSVLTLEQDAVHVRLGGNWRMPTRLEYKELFDNTKITWYTDPLGYKGTKGVMLTSKLNGNTLFLPSLDYGYVSVNYKGETVFMSGQTYWYKDGNPLKSNGDYRVSCTELRNSDHYKDHFSVNSAYAGANIRAVCE